MRGVLLAAGRGNRLRPLTDSTPKPLLRVGGKPILTWIIEGLRGVGITEIALITGYLGDQVWDYYRDGSSLGVEITYYSQEVRNGTAGAVLPAWEFLSSGPFFLGYGDILVAEGNYKHLVELFKEFPDDSVLTGWPSATPWVGGVLSLDKRDRLVGLIEKPDRALYEGQALKSPGNLINAGLMILQPEILDCIRKVKPSSRGELELTDALLDLAHDSIIRVMTLQRFWSDIGTHEKLDEADRFFSSGEIRK